MRRGTAAPPVLFQEKATKTFLPGFATYATSSVAYQRGMKTLLCAAPANVKSVTSGVKNNWKLFLFEEESETMPRDD